MKDYDKSKELSYLKYWDVNKFNGWAVSQNCLQIVLGGLKINLNLIKISQKHYNEENDEGYFSKADVQYPEILHIFNNDLSFLPKRMKTEKIEDL